MTLKPETMANAQAQDIFCCVLCSTSPKTHAPVTQVTLFSIQIFSFFLSFKIYVFFSSQVYFSILLNLKKKKKRDEKN